MSIPLSVFESAKPGDEFIDAEGKKWTVTECISEGRNPTLIMSVEKLKVKISFCRKGNFIIDERSRSIDELNDPKACANF